MPVPESSRIAYYNRVLSGTATSQKDRIMRYYLSLGRPATRHEAVDRYFCVHPGPRALDGGRPIPWQSAGGAIGTLVTDTYLRVDHHGKDPVTGAEAVEFLAPVGDRWAQRKIF